MFEKVLILVEVEEKFNTGSHKFIETCLNIYIVYCI